MSDKILISIGGTGAKCIESFIYLAAAGAIQDNVHIYFVDQDTNNNNLTDTLKLLSDYNQLRNRLLTESPGPQPVNDIFLPRITAVKRNDENSIWPLAEADANLETIFDNRDDELAAMCDHLLHGLYSEEQLDLKFKEGYHNDVSVGICVFIMHLLTKSELWGSLRNILTQDNATQVMVIASLFGGTGASGHNAITDKIFQIFGACERNTHNKSMAQLLLQPYYIFRQNGDEDTVSRGFLSKTVQGLLFHHGRMNGSDHAQQIYTLGHDPAISLPRELYSPDGTKQDNPPMLPELVAATAILDYFTQENSADSFLKLAKREKTQAFWNSLPDGPNKSDQDAPNTASARLASFLNFSFQFCIWHEQIKRCCKSTSLHKALHNAMHSMEGNTLLPTLGEFCKQALEWAGSISAAMLESDETLKQYIPIDFTPYATRKTPDKDDSKIIALKDVGEWITKPTSHMFPGFRTPEPFKGIDLVAALMDTSSSLPAPIRIIDTLLQHCRLTDNKRLNDNETDIGTIQAFVAKNSDVAAGIIEKPNRWSVSNEQGFSLASLAGILDPTALASMHQEQKSMPHPWAAMLCFHEALFDETHPLHGQAKERWGHLLAILALGHSGAHSPTFQHVDFSKLCNPHAEKEKVSFLDILAYALPKDPRTNTPLVSSMNSICLADRVMGFTSSYSLVFPAMDYLIPDGSLEWNPRPEPVNIRHPEPSLSLMERVRLLAYIKKQRTTVQNGDNATLQRNILPLLQSYEQDIRNSIEKISAQYPVDNLLHKMNPHFEFHHFKGEALPESLGSAPRTPRQTPPLCDVVIKPQDNSVQQRLIIFDPGIPDMLNRRPDSIIFWKEHCFMSLQRNSVPSLTRLINLLGSERETYIPILLDHLFTPKIVKTSNLAPEFKQQNNPGMEDYLLPITPLALAYFGEAHFQNDRLFSMSEVGQGAIKVSLTVELQSTYTEHGLGSISISKVYEAGEEIQVEGFDALTIFARHSINEKEFPFYTSSHRNMVIDQPHLCDVLPFSSQATPWQDLPRPDASESYRSINPIEDMFQNLQSFSHASVGMDESKREISMSRWQPRALLFNLSSGKEQHYAGALLLRPENDRPTPSGSRYTVAFDFGTTNSYGAFKVEVTDNNANTDDDTAHEQTFSFNGTILPVFSYNQAILEGACERSLVPLAEVSNPFMTIEQDAPSPDSKTPGGPKNYPGEPFLGGRILYASTLDPQQHVNTLANAVEHLTTQPNSFHFDLKWTWDPDNKSRIRIIFKQFIIQAAHEIIKDGGRIEDIRWRFSYPDLFKADGRLTPFKGFVITSLNEALGLTLDINSTDTLTFISEAKASSYYHQRHNDQYLQEQLMTIDIGGGTSDMSFSPDDQGYHHTISVPYAGQDIFSMFLHNNSDTVEDLLRSVRQLDLLDRIKNAPNRKDIRELIFNSNMFQQALDTVYGRDWVAPHSVPLLLVMSLAKAGLLYFMGLCLKDWDEILKKQEGSDASLVTSVDGKPIRLFLGGRGSGLMRHLVPHDQPNALTNDPYGLFITKGMGSDTPIRLETRFSGVAKQEVAYGMFHCPPGHDQDDDAMNVQDQSELSNKDSISKIGSKVTGDQDERLESFKDFLSTFAGMETYGKDLSRSIQENAWLPDAKSVFIDNPEDVRQHQIRHLKHADPFIVYLNLFTKAVCTQ